MLHDVNGTRINVMDEGDGHPLLLLHGLGGCWRDWEPQLDALRERHRVIVVEHRGHGRSDRITGPVSTDLFAADVAALCRGLGVDRAWMVGLSMGGMIAQKLALAEPDLVAALVLCDTGTHLGERASAWLREEADRVRAHGFLPDARGEVAGSTIWSRYTLDRQPEVARTNIRESQSTDPASWAEAALAVAAHDTRADVARIACPTLVIWGDEDGALPAKLADPLAAALDAALVVIPDAGHVCNLEQPAAFDRAVEDFLAGTLSR